MKVIIQDIKTGRLTTAAMPCPMNKSGCVIIRTKFSLISSGTERMLLEFGRSGWFWKIFGQVNRIQVLLDKLRTDGVIATWKSVRSKFEIPIMLGYCNIGIVSKIGEGVSGIAVGDRIISNGYHAEMVCVAENMCEKIPDSVDDESGAFAFIAAIGLQSVRLAQPSQGEVFAVIGVGLIGLIIVQLLRNRGCKIIAVDVDQDRLNLAKRFGAEAVNVAMGEDPVKLGFSMTNGRGIDGVIIAASSKSAQPIKQATLMCRRRGRIVLVGVVGLNLCRDDFYKKELSFQVSCSYGADRYERIYEKSGIDYAKEVWTVRDNLKAVLNMMENGTLDVKSLITHRYSFGDFQKAYDTLLNDRRSLGILLNYANDRISITDEARTVQILREEHKAPEFKSITDKREAVVGLIGAGNYAMQIMAPALKKSNAILKTVVSESGISAGVMARKYGFQRGSSNKLDLLEDGEINAVIIATRHDSHAQLVCDALEKRKNVFVEKPLAITRDDLNRVKEVYEKVVKESGKIHHPVLMIGFNRRFAPLTMKVKELFESDKEPKCFIYSVNAGFVPKNHWVHDLSIGGGRIVGEGCHFIDVLRFLAGSRICKVRAAVIGKCDHSLIAEDKVTITLNFDDGSMGNIHYFSNGNRSFPKERLEVFCAGRILQLDNFKHLRGYGWKNFRHMTSWAQDKGNSSCIDAFIEAIRRGEASPVPFDEILEVTDISLRVRDEINGGSRID